MGKYAYKMGKEPLKIGWIFPGQGSQFIGMGKDLYEKSGLARKLYEIADNILGFDTKSIVFEGTAEQLNKTKFTQPLIYVTSVILGKVLLDRGFEPFSVAGHSLGEYSALTISNSVSFEKGLELVRVRSRSMDMAGKINRGTMAAIVGLDEEDIQFICSSYKGKGLVVIANYNSPKQFVISGTKDAVFETMEKAKDIGARLAIELKVSGAFHSPLMKPAREALVRKVESIKFKNPQYPFFNNVDGKILSSGQKIKSSLVKQLERPVLWKKSILEMKKYGVESFLEVGPGKVLQGLNKRIDSSLISKGVDSLFKIEALNV